MAIDIKKKLNNARTLAKSTALNKIRKMYKKGGYSSDPYDYDSSYGEQRDFDVSSIIDDLERELEALKEKHI